MNWKYMNECLDMSELFFQACINSYFQYMYFLVPLHPYIEC